MFRNILESGFQGPVYPVNSNASFVQSVAAYRSILDCPGPVDLAIIVVPPRAVTQVTKDCAIKCVRSLVVITSGFAELGQEGAAIQAELSNICANTGMRLIGPNCMGIVNTDPGVSLNAQFSPSKPKVGKMGFLSQSGALGIAVIEEANRLGLGMSTFASVGNKADISGNDLVEYWENDEKTDLILLYLESFGNPRKFARITRRVSKKKPILVVKSGRSVAGFRATQSHTGAMLAASDVTVEALFKQSGVIRADTLAEMFDVSALLSTQPVPKGDRVAIITNAGGAGILAADACADYGLKVPELAQETQMELRSFLSPMAGLKNPVDMIASATPDDYARTIRIVANDPSVDAMLVIFIPPTLVSPKFVADKILAETSNLRGRIPLLATFMATHGLSGVLSDGNTRIPSYPFPETAARALSKAVQYGNWLAAAKGTLRTFPDIMKGEAAAIVAKALVGAGKDGRWLTSEETQAILSAYGISLVKSVQVKTPDEAGKVAMDLGQKIALKGIASGLVHKTEAGAVVLNLQGKEEVRDAAEKMFQRLALQKYTVEGFLVQPIVPSGIEMIVGVTCDPVFGPVVACGAGGILVELLKDISVRVTPLTDNDARDMVSSLKTSPLLNGYRGGPKYDRKSLEEVVLRIGALVEDIREISELDLNPLIVLPEGQGVRIVDARVRVAESRPPLPIGARKTL
ncbi:MAG: acetate--CoA ligase family protein, partial [Nitrososphaerota archaeon]|nr:acetate--CoA ligase family protein [Nitrososphaerota archaeon]